MVLVGLGFWMTVRFDENQEFWEGEGWVFKLGFEIEEFSIYLTRFLDYYPLLYFIFSVNSDFLSFKLIVLHYLD